MSVTKYLLSERDIPRQWYNIAADLPTPLRPPLHPGTGQPISPGDLAPLFPMGLIEQEVSRERWIDIPAEVLDIVPAPESSHAILGAITEARKATEEGKEKVILFLLSGHGHFDMSAYEAHFTGGLEDFELPACALEGAWDAIQHFPKP